MEWMDRIGRWTVGIYMSVSMLIHNSYLCIYRMYCGRYNIFLIYRSR